MIPETAFVHCESVPPEMAGRFDEPWHFVGEVYGDRSYVSVFCDRCRERSRPKVFVDLPSHRRSIKFQIIHLRGHLFITDDMIEVMVYFGICEECDAVHWARQGPPFTRVRCCVPA